MRGKAGTGLDAVELVVVLASGQRALAHVHIEHLPSPGQLGDDGEGAGIGKQVEHLHASGALVAQYLLAHPAAAGGHVQKQAMVLAACNVNEVLGPVFGDYMRLGQGAAHDAGFDLATGLTGLKGPGKRLVCRGNLLPALLQGLTDQSQLGFIQGRKAGQHDDGWKGVQRYLLAARIAAATAVKDALGIGAIGHLGNGG